MDVSTLNPGIRRVVALLHANGFDTVDSGDGRTHEYECDQPVPYVHLIVAPTALIAEADRVYRLLSDNGVVFHDPVEGEERVSLGPLVDAQYNPRDGIGTISLWHVDDTMLTAALEGPER